MRRRGFSRCVACPPLCVPRPPCRPVRARAVAPCAPQWACEGRAAPRGSRAPSSASPTPVPWPLLMGTVAPRLGAPSPPRRPWRRYVGRQSLPLRPQLSDGG
eukprot:scaffold686_cov342-Prasinococcus_capsulatus_cf.AAC.4